MSEKKTPQTVDEIAANTLSEVEGFIEAGSVIADVENEWQQEADQIKDQAVILAKAQNAMDNAVIGKPFRPSRENEELFAEINAVVEAQNEIDNGLEEADPHLKKEIDERFEEREWNPEAVIDEKIKEEQDAAVSQDLRNEIVDSFE